MSQEANLREVEAARQQARLSADKFERIRQATEKPGVTIPKVPSGRPPESVRHRAIEPSQLQQARTFRITKIEQAKPPKPPRIIRVKEQRRSRRGFLRRPRIFGGEFVHTTPLTHVRLREGTPANISRAEKDKALSRLDAEIARWSRKYTFRVVHGGTPTEKNEAAVRLRQLNSEKEAIEAMRPLGVPEHIRRAEHIES